MRRFSRSTGFTLAELLISLTILAVIATFSIPKILASQQNARKTAITKEVAAAVVNAWQLYCQDNTPTASTDLRVLEPYLNYVAKFTSGSHGDMAVTEDDMACSASTPCYQFASGAVLQLYNWRPFGGTSAVYASSFDVDPDGTYSGSQTGDGKGIELSLYFNGRLASAGTVSPGTQWGGGPYTACPACDPTWFSW